MPVRTSLAIRAFIALLALMLALSPASPARAQGASGVDVLRGGSGDAAGEDTDGSATETVIDPSGLTAPVTIVRGRVPSESDAVAEPCDCQPETRIVVLVDRAGYRRWGRSGSWQRNRWPRQHPWYSWMRSYRLGVAAEVYPEIRL